MNHPKPFLKYVDASHIDDRTLELSAMHVQSQTHENVGSVDGLIVDPESGRPYYVVVDAGGWFKSKHFLVPIGQLNLSTDKQALVVPLSKQQIDRFPGFDLDAFDELTDDGIKEINRDTLAICEPEATTFSTSDEALWTRPSYQMPTWWPGFGLPVMPDMPGDITGAASHLEHRDPGLSPDQDVRAQPGDVLGLETGGEQTHIGDTAEDEDARRREATHH